MVLSMKTQTPEPDIVQGLNPESALHRAVVSEVHRVLVQNGARFILVEKFGLDIGVFVQHNGKEYARFIEIKAFVGSRAGGVGFGNSRGDGPQVDILIQPTTKLAILDDMVLWLLGMGNLPKGRPRYAMFSSVDAKKAAMGTVQRGKQNNLRVSDFQNTLVTWEQVADELRKFLL